MSEVNGRVAKSLCHHPLYPHFIQVKNKLKEGGFVCWIAGGAVRDFLIHRTPADFDLVTDATTEQILKIFPEALTVGAQFGVVKLVLGSNQVFDLATFRRESDYIDGRRPSHIDFATPEEDAYRRDFTINALFWDEDSKHVVDFVEGLKDLEQRRLRCVGIASVRFTEDHLRILRLLRFSIQLQLTVEVETLAAAQDQVNSIQKISGERLWTEIYKMAPSIIWSDFIKDALAMKVFENIFPLEISKAHLQKAEPMLGALQASNAEPLLKLFYFLLNLAASPSRLTEVLKKRLHLSKAQISLFEALQYCNTQSDHLKVSEWVFEIEKKPLLLDVLRFLADLNMFNHFHEVEEKFQHRPEKKIDGNDLSGLVDPIKMGEALKKIRLLQFEQPELEKHEILERAYQNKIISTKHKT